MDDIWTQLVRYKIAEDKLNELKRTVWKHVPYDAEMKVTLEEAEQELEEVRQMIEMNGEVKRVD